MMIRHQKKKTLEIHFVVIFTLSSDKIRLISLTFIFEKSLYLIIIISVSAVYTNGLFTLCETLACDSSSISAESSNHLYLRLTASRISMPQRSETHGYG